MPETGLNGPYTLDNETIDRIITKKSPGAYALGHIGEKGGFVPIYVGRSDDDINDRLKKWVGKKYSKFRFKHYDSPKAAFEKECNLYHDWKKQLDNDRHPDRPDNSSWKCPRCKIFE